MKEFLKAKNQKKDRKERWTFHKEEYITWRHGKTRDDYQQVKFPQGGGTRTKGFKRSATYDEVLNVCKDLLFPNGISKHKGITINDVDIFLGNYCSEQVSVIDGEVLTVEKYHNHVSVSKGNTPRVYLIQETSNLIPPPVNETLASTSANVALDQSAESKEMLENFVHDALTEIGYDIMQMTNC